MEKNKMEWVSIKNKLPKKDGAVLIHVKMMDEKKPYINTAWYSPNGGWSMLPEVFVTSITHWMPLPKAPKI